MTNVKTIILFVLGAIAFCALYNIFFSHNDNEIEHLTELSDEALQNIANVYSVDNMEVTKITAGSGDISTLVLDTMKGKTNNNIYLEGNICVGEMCINSKDFMKAIIKLSKNDFMYASTDGSHVIYEDILDALTKNIIQKNQNPSGWDQTSFAGNSNWNELHILRIGNDQTTPNGLLVNVPANMSVIWLRILNERWSMFKLYDESGTFYGKYASGFRNLNTITPDGGTVSQYWNVHKWFPIALPPSTSARKFILVGGGPSCDNWLSGIAFSSNPWNHAMNSAVSYYWKLNSDSGVTWNSKNSKGWNNDQVAEIPNGAISILNVPVVYSGKDKLVYLVEHNDVWETMGHYVLKANDKPIERFKTTYDNPFCRHFNSKPYQRYVAALIPASYTSVNQQFIKISIDMTKQNKMIYFREAGTHDAY